MIHGLLPLFLVVSLVRAAVLGLIEGIAEATAQITRVFSGWLSDPLKKLRLSLEFARARFPCSKVAPSRLKGSMSKTVRFRKMNGLGNDFVVLDVRARALDARGRARSRHRRPEARHWLRPGHRARAFGRCRRLHAHLECRWRRGRRLRQCRALRRGAPGRRGATSAGQHRDRRAAILGADAESSDGSVTIDMGAPRFNWDEIPLCRAVPRHQRIELQIGPIDDPVLHTPSVVNVGNPHCIFFVEDVDAHDLARFGPMLEHHPLFPERANISLAQVTGPGSCGFAPGSAAPASPRPAARPPAPPRSPRRAAVSRTRGDGDAARRRPGHRWREDDDHILMTGPLRARL